MINVPYLHMRGVEMTLAFRRIPIGYSTLTKEVWNWIYPVTNYKYIRVEHKGYQFHCCIALKNIFL